MRVIFMGTPDFSVPCLENIHKAHEVIGVFTQPDRPQGRGKKIGMSDVKVCALKHKIPVYQPEKIRSKDTREFIESLKPDVIVVVAYGQLLSQKILDIPPLGCINVHASLLPAYRGSAPIHWAIVNGETQTGVTTMKMVKALDAGPMIHKTCVEIDGAMTTGQLFDRLSQAGGDLIVKTLAALEQGPVSLEDQDPDLVTFAPMMNKAVGLIQWSKTAKEIHNHIRGFNPWPTAYTSYEGQPMKVYKSHVCDGPAQGQAGTVASTSKEGILVNTGQGQICLEEIQLPNKKRMHVKDFLLGHTMKINSQLGE